MTIARMRVKLVNELRDEALRVPKEHEDELLRSLSREHEDVDVISSCDQTAADARSHRREAPQQNEEPVTNLHEMHQDSIYRAVDGEQAVARDAESRAQWR